MKNITSKFFRARDNAPKAKNLYTKGYMNGI
jgi:hypothetical protein